MNTRAMNARARVFPKRLGNDRVMKALYVHPQSSSRPSVGAADRPQRTVAPASAEQAGRLRSKGASRLPFPLIAASRYSDVPILSAAFRAAGGIGGYCCDGPADGRDFRRSSALLTFSSNTAPKC